MRRAIDRANKIAKRLLDEWGGATEDDYEFPPKPPRMRWATYNRLEEQYDEFETRWAVGAMAGLLGGQKLDDDRPTWLGKCRR